MKLGMPTLIELPDIYQTISLCKELGLSFIELNMNMPDFCPENLAPDLVRKISEKENIEFTLHLPEEIDLASFHPSIRRGHVIRCREAIVWAAQAGIKLVNLHLNSGIYFTLPDQKVWLYDKYQPQFISAVETAFANLLEVAQNSNIKLCIENAGNFHYSFIGAAIDRLTRLDGIRLTWDTGHDAQTGYREKETLLKYQNKIGHMHLHDYNGKSNHQVLFSGEINIGEMLSFANNHHLNVVIEVKTVDSLRKSIELLAIKGFQYGR